MNLREKLWTLYQTREALAKRINDGDKSKATYDKWLAVAEEYEKINDEIQATFRARADRGAHSVNIARDMDLDPWRRD